MPMLPVKAMLTVMGVPLQSIVAGVTVTFPFAVSVIVTGLADSAVRHVMEDDVAASA